jgi:hypothetical protein
MERRLFHAVSLFFTMSSVFLFLHVHALRLARSFTVPISLSISIPLPFSLALAVQGSRLARCLGKTGQRKSVSLRWRSIVGTLCCGMVLSG